MEVEYNLVTVVLLSLATEVVPNLALVALRSLVTVVLSRATGVIRNLDTAEHRSQVMAGLNPVMGVLLSPVPGKPVMGVLNRDTGVVRSQAMAGLLNPVTVVLNPVPGNRVTAVAPSRGTEHHRSQVHRHPFLVLEMCFRIRRADLCLISRLIGGTTRRPRTMTSSSSREIPRPRRTLRSIAGR